MLMLRDPSCVHDLRWRSRGRCLMSARAEAMAGPTCRSSATG